MFLNSTPENQRTEKTQSERENKLPDGLKRKLKMTEEKANKPEGS